MELYIKNLLQNKDYEGLRKILSANPSLANEGIELEAEDCLKVHPLHRICDEVFAGHYTEKEGLAMAKIWIELGADVNGVDLKEKQDSPLTAAISLYANQIALFYIQQGADIHHKGCYGGTALHWAAWCGSVLVLEKLLALGASVNQLCIDFQSTPLFWAIHGLKTGGEGNKHQQIACAKLLLKYGADKYIPNFEGFKPYQLLDEQNEELEQLLK